MLSKYFKAKNGRFEITESNRSKNRDEARENEFQEWRKHYNEIKEQNILSLDINTLENYYLVFKGKTKVGILYLEVRNRALYFIFYSLRKFTKKGLGLGSAVIAIVDVLARNNQCVSTNVLTVESCGVIPYYENRGFKRVFEVSAGLVELKKYL